MADDLIIKLYPRDTAFSALGSFVNIVEAVRAWPAFQNEWWLFRCGRGLVTQLDREEPGPLTSDEAVRIARECGDEPHRWFGMRAAFKCWRYHPGSGLADEAAYLNIDTWGANSPKVRAGAIDVEGCGNVVIEPADPFWALINKPPPEIAPNYNERVRENLNRIVALFQQIARRARPWSLKMFVDRGGAYPWNAHCVYFSGPEAVLADLQLIRRLWIDGKPYEDVPLNQVDPARSSFAFGELRTPPQRAELWEALRDLLPNLSRVTIEKVTEALEVTNLAVAKVDSGFVVYDSPYFLNSFVQNFYLNILELAG